MKENNIKKIYYSTNNNEIVCKKIDDLITDHVSNGMKHMIGIMDKIDICKIAGKKSKYILNN